MSYGQLLEKYSMCLDRYLVLTGYAIFIYIES